VAALGLTSAVALSAENGQESILRRALAEQRLHCAAESRPGFAEADGGLIYGLADDLCRAMAIAILGPSGDAEMRVPDADVDFEPLRDGSIDVGFVSAETIAGHRLAPFVIPGPIVFIDPITAMVPVSSPVRFLRDFEGLTICVMRQPCATRA
jgi:general L-amino acid transport system substrate-binding protein